MLKRCPFIVSFYTVLLVLAVAQPIRAQQLTHVLGELLVVPEESLTSRMMESKLATFENLATKANVQEMKTAPLPVVKLRFDHNEINENRFLEEVRNMQGVKMAQFNHLIEYRLIPDDPQFPQQWQYLNDGQNGAVEGADIDMDLAWDIATGGITVYGDTIVVCVIDGGMDPTHQDFGDNLWKNRAEIPGNGIDDDNNGYIDDFNGWSAYENNDEVFKGGSHGTPVAGIIGAQGNNGIGVSGVNWDVRLMIVRGGGDEAAALEAYAYPYTMRKRYNETNGSEGAFVVATNASWGTDLLHWQDAPIWCSFYDSLGQAGILNCGATANANYDIDVQGDMPTSCPSDYLISVTNLASDNKKVTGAGYGLETIDLGAYGAGTWTTALNNSYGGFGGTSGATPHVTGTVALAYATSCGLLADLARTDPGQAALLVKDFILSGAKPNESLQGRTVTGGTLNVYNTLIKLTEYCECPFPVEVDIMGIGVDQATIHWAAPVDTLPFDLVFRRAAAGEWDTLYNVTSPVLLTELQVCNRYEFKLRTRCPDGSGSFSFSYFFETEGCCIVPQSHEVYVQQDMLIIELADIIATDTYTLEYQLFGESAWQSMTRDTHVFSLPKPPDCAAYFYRFRSVCVDQESDFSGFFTYDTDCQPCTQNPLCPVGGNNFYEFIDSLEIGTFVNGSGRDPGNYGDFTFAVGPRLKNGRSYPFRLVPGFGDNTYDEFIAAFIDWNGDGTFGEEERVVDGYSSDGEVIRDSLHVPVMLHPGYTKMRIVLSFQQIEDPCESVTYGEIEDYCVYLESDASACVLEMLQVDTLEVGASEATFFWNDPEGASDFNCRYRKSGQPDWTNVVTGDTLLSVSGLDSCALYEFEVQPNCTDGLGRFSETFLFETDCINQLYRAGGQDHTLQVFPNPFNDQITLSTPFRSGEILRIGLYDALGIRMPWKDFEVDGKGNIRLDNLNNIVQHDGILFLQVKKGTESYIVKIVRME
jgi:subtilisin family serine protease